MRSNPSDDPGLAEPIDVRISVAGFAQNLSAMLAGFGQGRDDARGRARERNRLPYDRDCAAARMLQRHRHPEVLDLRIGEYFVDPVDRTGWHTGLLKLCEPVRRRLPLEDIDQDRGQPWPVAKAALNGRVDRIAVEVRLFERAAQRMPLSVTTNPDIDEAVGCREHAHRRRKRMIVTGLLRNLMVDQVACGLEIHERDLCLQQRTLDPLAFARALALGERDQNAGCGIKAGGDVGDGNTRAHRTSAGMAGDRHQPAHALRDLVKACTGAIGAGLSEAGNRRENDPPIPRMQGLVVDAEPILHVGPEILHHHVGPRHQLQKNVASLRVFQIQRKRALVTVQVEHVVTVTRSAHAFIRIYARGRLDLDHVGAEICQNAAAGRTCAHAGEVQNPKMAQRSGCSTHNSSSAQWTRARSATACGTRPCQQVRSCSATASASNARSECGRPTICMATGMCRSSCPTGTATAGKPSRLTKRVQRLSAYSVLGSKPAEEGSHSDAAGVVIGSTGRTRTSASPNSCAMAPAHNCAREASAANSISSSMARPFASRFASTGSSAPAVSRSLCERAASACMMVKSGGSSASIVASPSRRTRAVPHSARAATPFRHAFATGASVAANTSSSTAAERGFAVSDTVLRRAAAGACTSAALRPSRPTVSRLGASGIAPCAGTARCVGFHAVTPQACAGMRRDPPVSDPSATTTEPLATAAAEPEDDPPLIRSRFHGFLTRPRAL